MRNIVLLLMLLATQCVYSQTLVPVTESSKIGFRIKNFGISTSGNFTGLTGKIIFDPARPGEGSMDVTVPARSVDTDNSTRDNHLRKEDYFDVQNYPNIHFVSTKIVKSDKANSYIVTGKLTIKKKTKEVSIPFTVSPDNSGYKFSGEFTINRRDFGVGGGSTISDKLDVSLQVVTKKS